MGTLLIAHTVNRSHCTPSLGMCPLKVGVKLWFSAPKSGSAELQIYPHGYEIQKVSPEEPLHLETRPLEIVTKQNVVFVISDELQELPI